MNKYDKFLKSSFLIQKDQKDCGPACLASIVRFHNSEVSINEVRELSGTKETGTTLLGLSQAANSLGFDSVGLRADGVENLNELTTPSILHTTLDSGLDHFIVFYKIHKNKVVVGDPNYGIKRLELAQLDSLWKSKALLKLTPNERLIRNQIKRKKYSKIYDWVKQDINILTASLFLGIIISILSLAPAIFFQKLIDIILPSGNIKKLIIGLTLFIFILLIKSVFNYVRSMFLITQSQDFNNRMIASFFRSLLILPKSFFDSRKTGDMIARMNDTQRIQMALSSFTGNLLIEVLVIIAALIGIYSYSLKVGLCTTLLLIPYFFIIKKFTPRIVENQRNVMSKYAINEINYLDIIKGVSVVKATNSIDSFIQKTIQLYKNYQSKIFDLGLNRIKLTTSIDVLGLFILAFVVTFSSVLVLQDNLVIGSMIALLTFTISINSSLQKGAVFCIQIFEAMVAYLRMEEFVDLKPEKDSGKSLTDFESLELVNVSFNYPGSTSLFHQINLKVKQNSFSVIMGESGVGKSTLLDLCQRFYSPTTGTMFINGENVENINLRSFRSLIGVIPQEIKIFNGSLLFNITLSNKKAINDLAMGWCKRNGFDEHFKHLAYSYSTYLGEDGVNVSGGQRQLIAWARALFLNPSILLVDEGTSALDQKIEEFLMTKLEERRQSVGILYITHKSTIKLDNVSYFRLFNGHLERIFLE